MPGFGWTVGGRRVSYLGIGFEVLESFAGLLIAQDFPKSVSDAFLYLPVAQEFADSQGAVVVFFGFGDVVAMSFDVAQLTIAYRETIVGVGAE